MIDTTVRDINPKKSIITSWSWIFLLCIFLPVVSIYGICALLPIAKGSDLIIWLGICICAFLFGALETILHFYRFIIDQDGIRMQRLLYSRFYPWSDIKEIIVSSRGTIGRFIQTAIICTEKRRPYIKLDVGGLFEWPKWCICIDLHSKDFPAEYSLPYVDKEPFFQLIKEHAIEINYDYKALMLLKRK